MYIFTYIYESIGMLAIKLNMSRFLQTYGKILSAGFSQSLWHLNNKINLYN